MMYYVAGGAVRDLILGRPLRDVDYVFDGAEEVFIQRNPAARKIKGMVPPLYLLEGQEFSPVPDGPDALCGNIGERDFTINALLLDQNGVIRAHPQCFADLAQGSIRPVSERSLEDSPVRALRAARFAATLPGFSPHEECLERMRALPREALAGIAAEQAGRETLKACLGGSPGNYLRVLEQGRCLDVWFPELGGTGGAAVLSAAATDRGNDPSPPERAARLMDAVALACRTAALGDKERQCAVWMALCHTIGMVHAPESPPALNDGHGRNGAHGRDGEKAAARRVVGDYAAPDDSPHGHTERRRRGAKPALALGERLRLSRRLIQAGDLAARLRQKGGDYINLPPGAKVDLLMTLHKADIAEVFFLLTAAAGAPRAAAAMRDDLARVVVVRLPKDKRNRGAASGVCLHALRRRALG